MRIRTLIVSMAAAVLTAAAMLAGAAPASATTITVAPGQSIQAAIDRAANGDVIQVQAGTYAGNLKIDGKYVTLRGNVNDPGSVVLRPTTTAMGNAVLWIQNVPDAGAGRVLIEGLQISGGNSVSGQGGGVTVYNNAAPEFNRVVIVGNQATQGYGGGMSLFQNADAYIHDSYIQSNYAYNGGGGILAVGSDPVIVGNVISDNVTSGWAVYGTSLGDGGSSGGGIYLESVPGNAGVRSHPVILGNTFHGNTATFAGGGVMLRTGVDAIIEGNTIDGNSAPYGGGVHIETTGSTLVLDGNVISNNSSTRSANFSGSGYGGGIAVYDRARVSILRNTISGNTATDGGAGLALADSSVVTLDGNTIAGNTATGAADGLAEGGGVLLSQATLTATNNLVDDNTAGIGGGIGLFDGSTSTVAFNTFVRNHESFAYGGAIFVRNSGGTINSAVIADNVFAGNEKAQIFEQSPKAIILNNLFDADHDYWGTGSYQQASGLNALATADGNRDGDPAFLDAGNDDFRIGSTSDAIGLAVAGSSIPTVIVDRRGAVRSGSPADVGAYTYAVDPVFSSDPTLRGDPLVGSTLSATPGAGGTVPSDYAYRWLRDGAPIDAAVGATYLVTLDDEGHRLSVAVTATQYGHLPRTVTTPPTAAVVRDAFFADVRPGQMFFDNIQWMGTTGLSTGSPQLPHAPLYKPADSVSRQAMAAFLYRYSGDSFTPPAEPTFDDVPATNPFYPQIEWMAAQGISTGTPQPSGKPLFKPANSVSREAMALFLARFAGIDVSTPPTAESFADVPIAASSAAAIAWMKDSGISTGSPAPSGAPLYKPADAVSRQAMAAFLQRLDDYLT